MLGPRDADVERLIQSWQLHAALPVAESCVELEPNNAKAWAQLGQVLMLLKQAQPAIRVLERALQLDPKLATVKMTLAAACFEHHEEARGMLLLEQAMNGDQLNDHLWIIAAQHLMKMQMRLVLLDKARHTLQMVMSRIRQQGATQVLPAWMTNYQWQLAPCWWQLHSARRVRIRRAQPTDAAWIKACFADDHFAQAVNREYASRLRHIPEVVLGQQLQAQLMQSPVEQGAVLWLIDRIYQDQYQTIGLASFANIDIHNHRAEFSIGFPEPLPSSVVVIESVFLLADIFFRQLGMRKATASIYEDNPKSEDLIAILLRLGFQSEGVLREQVRVENRYVNLHIFGALRHEVLANAGFQRNALRFLKHPITAVGA